MSDIFELNGRSYRWVGGSWLDAQTYISPPGVIQQELNHRYGHLVEKEMAVRKKRQRSSSSSQSKSIQKTIGPIIVDFVRQRYFETHTDVGRDEITKYLLNHPEASAFLRQTYAQTKQEQSFTWYVGNQVDWFSADYENPNRSEYNHLLEKTILPDGKKGYRPK